MLGNIPNFPQEKKKQAGGITPGETTDIIVKIEIKEEPCRIKDEDTEEQIDLMEVNEDKLHQFQKTDRFTNEDGNAVFSKTEENFTQKQAGKSGVRGLDAEEAEGKAGSQMAQLITKSNALRRASKEKSAELKNIEEILAKREELRSM
ncbi:hypothetical protein F2P79_008453 [Pimephales promelas]|nr:hypothetical protein F2P79_008453 [Pimephales promelas]